MTIELKRCLWPEREFIENGLNKIPWGYTKEGDVLVPNPSQLDYLEAGKQLVLLGQSLREVAAWISDKTGHKLSHMGLKRRQELDNKYFQTLDSEDHGKVYWEGDIQPVDFPTPTKSFSTVTNRKTDKQVIRSQKTQVAKKLAAAKIKAGHAKKALTRSQNEMRKILSEAENNPELREEVAALIPEELTNPEENIEVIFRPNEGPQTNFLAASEDEVFYGGAKGGGKTYALVADVLQHIHNPDFRGILFRQTTQALREVERASKKLYDNELVKGRYNSTKLIWTFPSGAVLELGYGETEDDVERYRGNQYSWLGFDELPQWPDSSVYDAMKSCVRVPKGSNLKTYIRATGNPGNVGSHWVKKYFIDPSPSNKTFFRKNEVRNPITKEVIQTKVSFKYIPATLFDNPMIDQEQYLAQLADLPDKRRKQLLEGNWDIVEGSAFEEFDRSIHVCEPFKIPANWTKFRAADWGFNSPFCCLWFAVDWDDNIYVYREYYGKGVYDVDWAGDIVKREKEKVRYGVIDGSTDSNRGETGPSTYYVINKVLRAAGKPAFKKADRSPGSRASGKQRVHEALALRETGQLDDKNIPIKAPKLKIFNTCTNLIRTLPILSLDKIDPEKVDKRQEDHAYDALRYGLMSRPSTPKKEFLRSHRTVPQSGRRDPFNIFGN